MFITGARGSSRGIGEPAGGRLIQRVDAGLRPRRLHEIADFALELEGARQRQRGRRIEVGRQPVLGGGALPLLLRLELPGALEVLERRGLHRAGQVDADLDFARVVAQRLAVVRDGRVIIAALDRLVAGRQAAAAGASRHDRQRQGQRSELQHSCLHSALLAACPRPVVRAFPSSSRPRGRRARSSAPCRPGTTRPLACRPL